MSARTTRAGRWSATLLVDPTGPVPKTLVAAGKITGGVFTWKLPTLPPTG